jgi:hypothetical protein
MLRPERAFDGATYNPERDCIRLSGQLARVYNLMIDGKWRTLGRIVTCIEGGSEAAVSARLRDLRKKKYGNHVVEREYITGGLFKYRLLPPEPEPEPQPPTQNDLFGVLL